MSVSVVVVLWYGHLLKKLSRQETPNSVCERTPTRSEGLCQDPLKATCARSLYQDPVGQLVQDLCFRISV